MRPQTYLQIRHKVGIASHSERIFTIAPPRIEEALTRRLQFAREIADGRLQIPRLKGISFDLINFSILAQGLSEALRDRKLKRFFSNFFGGNVGDAIHAVTKFFGNPNVYDRRIIRFTKMRGGFSVHAPDMWRSILYERFVHYSPTTSRVLNLFDVRSSNPAEHFLLPMILGYLSHDGPHRRTDGSVSRRDIVAEMQDWGFGTAITTWALERTLGRDIPLVEQIAYASVEREGGERFRITTTGAYYLSEWVGDLVYLEAMWCDTPGFDDSLRRALISSADESSPDIRHSRAIALRDYLTEAWKRSRLQPPYFNWMKHIEGGQKNFYSVGSFVEPDSRGGPGLRDRMAAWLRWILGSIMPPISPRLPA